MIASQHRDLHRVAGYNKCQDFVTKRWMEEMCETTPCHETEREALTTQLNPNVATKTNWRTLNTK